MYRFLILTCFISLSFFSNAQSVVVTQPNGGEVLYACQTYLITWNASGTSNFYDIDYSLNNGSIWASVASNLNVTNGQYSWTVPFVESNTCLIRVRDRNDTTKKDISDANFTIHIPVVVTAPNGGEIWQGGSSHLITWDIQGTSLTFNLDYSTNGGSSWNTIVTNLSTSVGSYNWTVANTPSTNCLVRVRDAVTNCMQDQSNNAFTITAAQPVLTYPNGGEQFSWNQPVTITWNSATYYSTVRLEYSLDNGLTWVLINAGATNNGSYGWTVPYTANINSTTCLIKASNSANVSSNDVSNAVFSMLKPTVTVTAPNGGESLLGCNNFNITYTLNNTYYIPNCYNIYIEYSTDNGATWNSLSSTTNCTNLTGPYSLAWTVPNGVTSSQSLVRVYSTTSNYTSINDTSNTAFSIQPNNVITVTSPNGGEIIPALSNYVINWTYTAGASGLFNVQYSSNNGSNWTTLATGISGNTYNWTNIPNVPSTTYLVRVLDNANTCKYDQSNNNFTVTAAQPILTYPNGGEQFGWNQPVTITWNSATYYSTVRLEYSLDNGLTWVLINAGATNNGSYNWTVPYTANINSTTCLIKASNSANVNSNDVSNAVFSMLKPTVTVTAPNGGESLLGCNNFNITYTLNNTYYIPNCYNIYIEYSTDNGATWNSLSSTTNCTNLTGPYSLAWTVPNGVTSSQSLVRVYSTTSNYTSINDTSNTAFSIQPNNVITVTSPNGGEIIPALSNYVINWTYTAGASGLFNVQYSSNNGSSWTTLATGISGNTYNWTNIPNVPSTTYLVRVLDNANTCKYDQSNNNFTVTAAQPILTYPNGGEQFGWNQPVTITWNSATYYSTVRLEYSLDNGLTWVLINAGATNNGSYNWTVPYTANINSTTCLIKASNSANVNSNDVSNAVFSMLKPTVTVTAPNGGESLLGCNNFNITYTLNNTYYIPNCYNIYIEYSTDNGATWNSLSSTTNCTNLTGPYSLAWTVPNGVTSSQSLVRVYSTTSNYTSINDTSNTAFSIQPNNVITVTSPNGGEIIPALSNYVINWTYTAGASGLFNVQYSSNNGSSWTTLATGISGNTYNWTNIPNVPSTTYLVRVLDNANTCKYDQSNNNFTVTAAQPILTYPNGGEQFGWNQPVTITWNSATYYSTVRLEYSLDNGLTWVLINAGATNNGSYNWTVPYTANINSTTCLIKASNSANVSSNDVSNAVFSMLKPTVTVTAPNGGESLLGCNNFNITYTLNNTYYIPNCYNIYIEYSTDNGATWNSLSSTTNCTNLTGPYSLAWTVPNGVTSSQSLVRVYSTTANYTSINDTSNTAFSIQPNNVITVTSPNGGEIIPALSNYVINWTYTAGASGLFNVQYSSNNGSSWTTLATGISGNTYNWTNIPNVPSTTYLVRVLDNANTCKYDQSNNNFTVTAAQPILTYPNGGEQLWSLNNYNITWNTSTFYSSVRLEYSLDNGLTWILINSGATNNGSYSWTPPNSNSAYCLIKASNSVNISINDISNAVFTIKPVVKVLSPNGLDQLGACTQTSINFEHTPAYTNFTIDYSVNNGTSWTNLITNTAFPATTGSYTWTIPNLPTTQALVRVYPNGVISYVDQSDSLFTIKPSVSIVQPNYGGILQVGTVYPIKWSSDGISNLYDIAYSTSGSSGPWTNIVIGYNTASNTYSWTVPNIPSGNCYIRVRDNASACKEDISNLAFTISATPSPITVVTSNGTDTLKGCQSYNITWSESGAPIGSYTIDLSADGGLSWSNVVTSYATTGGSYTWVVPNINTSTALLRVASATVSTIYDVSDLSFIINARKVKATPDTVICSGATVNLLATGGTGTYTWSPSTYLNNTNTANPTATPVTSINYIVSSSNGTCIMRDTASIIVQQVPSFNITADATNVCGLQLVTFTAHVTNGGSNPTFQWKRNNINIGNNDSTFRVNTLNNNDTITCVLTFNPSCFAPITSNSIAMTVNPKPVLGPDSTVSVSCGSCTVNLNNYYNTTGYAYVSWNTATPAAASPGIYRLVVSQLNGCTCPDTDTAFVYVNAYSGFTGQACATGSASFASAIIGTNYQWQVDAGAGYTNIGNSNHYEGTNAIQLLIKDIPTSFAGYKYRCLVNGSSYSDVYTLKITAYWQGTVNTDWENPANWGCGVVPDVNTEVMIYAGKPRYPEINCNRVCKSIYAAPGTSLKVNSNKLLYLKGK